MNLLTRETTLLLWHDVIKHAENRCSVELKEELEAYLVSLLIRFTDKPELTQEIVATTFLTAMQKRATERSVSLQHVGDQCLLFAGLFPSIAQKRHVKLSYFVDLGRSAYGAVSGTANGLYGSLALQFVVLMDVLQSIRESSDLTPFEAFQQWDEIGSQRALSILQGYTNLVPLRNLHK